MKLLAIVLLLLAPLEAAALGPSYQGLWWKSPAGMESGWGINLTHQGDVLFATWFTYDRNGNGQWLVMPDGMLQMPMNDSMDMNDMTGMLGMGMMPNMMVPTPTYTGTIYRTTGPAFDAATFDPAKVTTSPAGYATFMFNDSDNGTFVYVLDNEYGSKTITREVFGATPSCDFDSAPGTGNFQDLWWRSGGIEPGWGLNVAQQGDIIFATWFTYDHDGKGMWLVMPDAVKTAAATWQGKLYRTQGPAFDAQPWNGTGVLASEMGSATLSFTDAANGVFTANVGSATIAKPISREAYASPASVCR